MRLTFNQSYLSIFLEFLKSGMHYLAIIFEHIVLANIKLTIRNISKLLIGNIQRRKFNFFDIFHNPEFSRLNIVWVTLFRFGLLTGYVKLAPLG